MIGNFIIYQRSNEQLVLHDDHLLFHLEVLKSQNFNLLLQILNKRGCAYYLVVTIAFRPIILACELNFIVIFVIFCSLMLRLG